jgi:DNA replication licensing factor MCM3
MRFALYKEVLKRRRKKKRIPRAGTAATSDGEESEEDAEDDDEEMNPIVERMPGADPVSTKEKNLNIPEPTQDDVWGNNAPDAAMDVEQPSTTEVMSDGIRPERLEMHFAILVDGVELTTFS